MYIQTYFKELAYIIMGAGKSETQKASWKLRWELIWKTSGGNSYPGNLIFYLKTDNWLDEAFTLLNIIHIMSIHIIEGKC